MRNHRDRQKDKDYKADMKRKSRAKEVIAPPPAKTRDQDIEARDTRARERKANVEQTTETEVAIQNLCLLAPSGALVVIMG